MMPDSRYWLEKVVMPIVLTVITTTGVVLGARAASSDEEEIAVIVCCACANIAPDLPRNVLHDMGWRHRAPLMLFCPNCKHAVDAVDAKGENDSST